MRSFTILLVLCLGGGGCKQSPIETPIPLPIKLRTIQEAKDVAKEIAGQSCVFTEYTNSLGADDYGEDHFDCEKGSYVLITTQSHLYDHWFTFKKGEVVVFRYSDILLIKPIFLESGSKQNLNPAYYLRPVASKFRQFQSIPLLPSVPHT